MVKIFDITERHVEDWDYPTLLDAWEDGLLSEDNCDKNALRAALVIAIGYVDDLKDHLLEKDGEVESFQHEILSLGRELDDIQQSMVEVEAELAYEKGLRSGLEQAIRIASEKI